VDESECKKLAWYHASPFETAVSKRVRKKMKENPKVKEILMKARVGSFV
jgi:hypothetical protein